MFTCFNIISGLIEEANKRFEPFWTVNKEKFAELENYCDAIDRMAKEYDAVVIGTCNAILYEEQAKLVQNLLQTFCKTKVVVAMDSPYDYEVLGEMPNYICTYGVAAASARAAVDVMLGRNPGNAKPPVLIEV